MSAPRVFLVAAEPSGDALAADLVDALRRQRPDVALGAVGGPRLASRGLESPVNIDGLAVLGFAEGIRAYPRVVRLADEVTEAAIAFEPDAAVLIDSWGFTIRVAQRLKLRAPQIKRVKYIGPQVWATRPGRAKTLAAAVDHLICICEIETPFYAPFGLPCTVCGHPAVGRFAPGDAAAFRARHGLGEAPIVAVLPGSRRSEIRRTAPYVLEAGKAVVDAVPGARAVLVAAAGVADEAVAAARDRGLFPLVVPEEDKSDAFAAASVAIATSGTVTTEVGLQGAPVIVAYRLGWVTWALARAGVWKSKYATLMNVALGREAAPEFIQTRCTVENLAAAALRVLRSPQARAHQIAEQNEALAKMGRGGRPAADIAAEAILAVADGARG